MRSLPGEVQYDIVETPVRALAMRPDPDVLVQSTERAEQRATSSMMPAQKATSSMMPKQKATPAVRPKEIVRVPAKKAHYESVIHMFSKELTSPFQHCALIGSSSLMLGLGLGDKIDSHDTVIRVNRLPNASYQPDFGSRTDVLFVNRFTLRAEMSVDILGGGAVSCTENPRKCKKAFGAMIFKGSGPNRPWGKYTRYMRAFPFPIGHQLNENARVATRMPVFRLGKGHVTSGFMGFIAFTPICETITLYGFGGLNSADGHSEKQHYLRGEHELLRRASTGNLRPVDMHSPDEEFHNDSAWVLGHLLRMKDKINILNLEELRRKRGLPGGR